MNKPEDKKAGWKPDPRGSERLRYWNGTYWTQRFAEPTQTGETPVPEASPAGPDPVETPKSSLAIQDPSETPETSQRERNPWKIVALSAIAFAFLLAAATAVAVIANQPPEEKIGTVSAPGFDPELAGGGLSSSQIGADVLLGSVRSSASTGFQILQDGIEENAIDEFKQIQPRAGWDTEFEIDSSGLKLRFRNKDSFFIVWNRASSSEKYTADEIETIASRYGFFDRESGADFADLRERTLGLLKTLNERSLTIGVSESDLAAEAYSLAEDWDAWISENSESSGVPLAKSSRAVIRKAEELAASPSDSGLVEYNDAIDRFNAAVDKYNESL